MLVPSTDIAVLMQWDQNNRLLTELGMEAISIGMQPSSLANCFTFLVKTPVQIWPATTCIYFRRVSIHQHFYSASPRLISLVFACSRLFSPVVACAKNGRSKPEFGRLRLALVAYGSCSIFRDRV